MPGTGLILAPEYIDYLILTHPVKIVRHREFPCQEADPFLLVFFGGIKRRYSGNRLSGFGNNKCLAFGSKRNQLRQAGLFAHQSDSNEVQRQDLTL